MKVAVVFLFLIGSVYAGQYKDIFIVNHGWHAGIVIKTTDINISIWNIDSSFKKFEYMEVGWGDKDFYKSSNPSTWLALKAALIPTSSVLHIKAITKSNLNKFSKKNIIKISISKEGFKNLLIFIKNSFAKKDGKLVILGNGLYPNSFFYLSSLKYHIFNTCNVWTAKALQSAGLNISPSLAITTENLFSQIKNIKNQP